MKIMKTKKYAE